MSKIANLVEKVKAQVGNDPSKWIATAATLEAETKNTFFGTRLVVADVCRELRRQAANAHSEGGE